MGLRPTSEPGRTSTPDSRRTAPTGQPPAASRYPGRIRYQNHHTLVTDSVVVTASGDIHPVVDLVWVGEALGPRRREPARVLVAAVTAGAILLAAAAILDVNPWLLTGIGIAYVLAAARLAFTRYPRRRDVIAVDDDHYVTLFSTFDRRELGCVHRAVARAMEIAHG